MNLQGKVSGVKDCYRSEELVGSPFFKMRKNRLVYGIQDSGKGKKRWVMALVNFQQFRLRHPIEQRRWLLRQQQQ